MKESIRTILQRWGTTVQVVTDSGTAQVRAMVVPTFSQSWKSANRIIRSLGEVPYGQLLYLGAPEVDPRAASYLECQGQKYLLRRCEPLRLRDEVLYYWGLAVPMGKEQASWEN